MLLIVGIAGVVVGAALLAAALVGGKKDAGTKFSRNKLGGKPVQPCPASLSKGYPQVLTPQAASRAQRKLATLSPAERRVYEDALAQAKSDKERAYITKAFAACHTPQECASFGKGIRGKDDKWMQDNLSLTGSSKGTGVQQQWSHSCNATTAQAIRGQMDPVYALKTHQENPNWGRVDGTDATKQNPKLAAEQQTLLTSEYSGSAAGRHSGVAVGRDQLGGSGRWGDDLFNRQKGSTGVQYTNEKAPANPTARIDEGLKTGAPVPIVIGNGADQYTHYVLVTGSQPGPPAVYIIHDPWSGKSVQRSADDIKNGRIDLAGSNQVTAIDVPKAVPREPPGKPPC